MKNILFFTISALLFISCSNDDSFDVNLNEFDPVPESYPYAEIHPLSNPDYIAFVRKIEGEEYILGTIGNLCSEENTEDTSCVENFENITSDTGFYYGCLPSSCLYYIKGQSESENFVVGSREELIQFLGDINTRSEALLVAFSNGYYFSDNNLETGAYKAVSDGYELIGLKMVRDCTPLQTNRYHLKAKTNGELIVLDEEVYSVDENACV